MNRSQEFDCIVPAAGLSSRMGTWKLMTDFSGRPLIIRTVENALTSCGRVIMVTGHRGDEIAALFSADTRVICTRNDQYHRGMFSSIQTGAALVSTEWFFITLGDMPAIPPSLFELLADQIHLNPTCDIIRPVHEGHPGHPVLLKQAVAQTILSLESSADMRAVFSAHQSKTGQGVLNLPVDIPGSVYDIDTAADLEQSPFIDSRTRKETL